MSDASSSVLRIGYVPEHYLLPLHLATFTFPVELVAFPAGTGDMITCLRADSIDLAIGLTEGWVAGLLTPGGRKEKGFKIVGGWVKSPLRWAIVTGRNRDDINDVGDLQKHNRVGVSRLGSGSHIMAFVLARQEGWASASASASAEGGREGAAGKKEKDALDIVPLGPLVDLIGGVAGKAGAEPAADFFMWEHFTTKPHFHGEDSPLKKIGEIYTPWPSWHIVASDKKFPHPASDEKLAKVFEVLDRGIRRFNNDPEPGLRMLGTGELGCYYGDEDARQWLGKAEFVSTTRGVDRQVLTEVLKVLQGAGVVDHKTSLTDGDGIIGIERV